MLKKSVILFKQHFNEVVFKEYSVKKNAGKLDTIYVMQFYIQIVYIEEGVIVFFL